jgi:hypothetical protein
MYSVQGWPQSVQYKIVVLICEIPEETFRVLISLRIYLVR